MQEDIHINSINRFVGVNVGVKEERNIQTDKEARNSQTDKEARYSQTDKAKKQRTINAVYKDVSFIEENQLT